MVLCVCVSVYVGHCACEVNCCTSELLLLAPPKVFYFILFLFVYVEKESAQVT